MGLYLGNSEKLKINLGNTTYSMNIFSVLLTIEGVILSSLDNRLLKDFNGLYLMPKEEN